MIFRFVNLVITILSSQVFVYRVTTPVLTERLYGRWRVILEYLEVLLLMRQWLFCLSCNSGDHKQLCHIEGSYLSSKYNKCLITQSHLDVTLKVINQNNIHVNWYQVKNYFEISKNLIILQKLKSLKSSILEKNIIKYINLFIFYL